MKLLFKIVAFLLILLSNLIEIMAVRLLLVHKLPEFPWQALIFHLVASVVLTAGLWLFRLRLSENSDSEANKTAESTNNFYSNPMMVPAFCMSFFMPVFGAFTVSLLSLLFKPTEKNDTEVFSDYLDYVKSIDDDIQRFDRQPEERLILRFLQTEPVVDLLKSKSKPMIWGSIDNLSRRADQTAVNLIRDSIRQEDAEIKFLASIGLEKMEEQLIKKVEDAQTELLEKNDLQAHKNFIEAVLDYLTSDISPSELNTGLIEEALKAIKSAEEKFSATGLKYHHARILFLSGDLPECLKITNELFTAQKLEDESLPFALEVYFKTGCMDRVKDLLKRLVKCPNAEEILEKQLYEIAPAELEEFWQDAFEEQKL